jgi:hypothetical protein
MKVAGHPSDLPKFISRVCVEEYVPIYRAELALVLLLTSQFSLVLRPLGRDGVSLRGNRPCAALKQIENLRILSR